VTILRVPPFDPVQWLLSTGRSNPGIPYEMAARDPNGKPLNRELDALIAKGAIRCNHEHRLHPGDAA
jgi:hypothetical protein